MAELTPAEIITAITKNAVLRQRYTKGVLAKMLRLLLDADATLLGRIESRLEWLSRADRERLLKGDWSTQRLEALRDSIIALSVAYRDALNQAIRTEGKALVGAEIVFAESLAGRLTIAGQAAGAIPSAATIYTAAVAQPFQGEHLRTYVSNFEKSTRARMLRSVRQSFVQGDSVQDAVRTLRGTKRRNYRDGVLDISKRGATMVVRTSMTHLAARTHENVYQDLGVTQVEYVATLDGRTTLICANLDGKKYDIDKPHPTPPMHPNCRSSVIPVIDDLPNPELTERASVNGPVQNQQYPEWFGKQPAEFQRHWLGPTRYKLFKDGGYTIDKFVDPRSNRIYTIEELTERYGAAANGQQ